MVIQRALQDGSLVHRAVAAELLQHLRVILLHGQGVIIGVQEGLLVHLFTVYVNDGLLGVYSAVLKHQRAAAQQHDRRQQQREKGLLFHVSCAPILCL